MHVQVDHHVGAAEARARIDRVVDALIAREWAGAVSVRRPQRTWEDDRLTFSFELTRGIFAMTVAGFADVGEDWAAIDVAIPGMIESFVGSDRIRTVLERELSAALQ